MRRIGLSRHPNAIRESNLRTISQGRKNEETKMKRRDTKRNDEDRKQKKIRRNRNNFGLLPHNICTTLI